MNRRRFLQGATIASGIALTARGFADKSPVRPGGGASAVPRVCSTWDFGVAADPRPEHLLIVALLEIAASSVASALAAQAGGARRVELCAGLEVGAMTPSHGSIVRARDGLMIPLYVLIRPRAGDFVYDELELATIRLWRTIALRDERTAQESPPPRRR
jgi:hypothetical protein